MKPRKLLQKETLSCGCHRYTYQTMVGLFPPTESELLQCFAHREKETVPVGNIAIPRDLIADLMEGPAPKERDVSSVHKEPHITRGLVIAGVMAAVVVFGVTIWSNLPDTTPKTADLPSYNFDNPWRKMPNDRNYGTSAVPVMRNGRFEFADPQPPKEKPFLWNSLDRQ